MFCHTPSQATDDRGLPLDLGLLLGGRLLPALPA